MPVGLVRTRNNEVINIRKLEGCSVLWNGMRDQSQEYSTTIDHLSYEFRIYPCKECPHYLVDDIPF